MNSQSGGKYKIKQLSQDLAHIDKGLLELIVNHEERLQALEKFNIRLVLRRILQEINKISDDDKRNVAVACFAELLDAFGIKDLEVA